MLTRVETNRNGSWIEVCDGLAVEQVCTAMNIRRFTQANHTPPLIPQMMDLTGWTANTEYSNAIVSGTADTILAHLIIFRLLPFLSIPQAPFISTR
jgi:hypothetical protein